MFTHFVAEDPDSGRQSFFPARFSEVEVTDLVKGNLNSVDARTVTVRGSSVVGKHPGKTNVQVSCGCFHFENERLLLSG